MKRIGILGGTFDPIHNGHVDLAEDAKEQVGLQRVLLIPARHQPFKLDKQVAGAVHRLEMARLAVAGIPGLEVSDHELRQNRISYTYLTLEDMQRQEGANARLFFITGTDAFLKISTWKCAEQMLHNYSFAVGSRPGYREEELTYCIEALRTSYDADIVKIENRRRNISATEIRQRLERGKSLKGLVPETVERYIEQHGLY